MRVGQIILRVSDLNASVRFWTETFGLTLISRGGSFAFLDGESIQLALNEMNSVPEDESLTEIVFEAEDVRREHDDLLARGVPFEVDLRAVTSDGNRDLLAAHFRDPDGHLGSVVGWVDSG